MANLNYDYHFPKKSKPTIDEINQHFPYKSFKVFFDKENYLFTEYRNVVDYSAVAILESYDETVLIVDSCNCGYGGYGPNNTIALLKLIGVSEETASEYVKFHNAVELYFDNEGKILDQKTNLMGLFESRKHQLLTGQINLDNIDYIRLNERKLYFLNPIGEQIFTLTQLIHVMNPTKFIYFTGDDNTAFIDIKINTDDYKIQPKLKKHPYSKIEKYKFAVIKGEYFDVVCLISDCDARTMINMLALAMGIPAPFLDTTLFGIDFMVKSNERLSSTYSKLKYLYLLLKRKKNNQQEYFEIPIKQRREKICLTK